MTWGNPNLVLFHGCDEPAANGIMSSPIDLTRCRAFADFGQGFYTTTSQHQAEQWANVRAKATGRKAAVVELYANREELIELDWLQFVVEGYPPGAGPFWDFVTHSRAIGNYVFARRGASVSEPYDAVCGPLTLYPQALVIHNCDQYSFHSDAAVNMLYKQGFTVANPWY